MSHAKRVAVTVPAGPKLEHTLARLKWAEDNGIPDACFPIRALRIRSLRLRRWPITRRNYESVSP